MLNTMSGKARRLMCLGMTKAAFCLWRRGTQQGMRILFQKTRNPDIHFTNPTKELQQNICLNPTVGVKQSASLHFELHRIMSFVCNSDNRKTSKMIGGRFLVCEDSSIPCVTTVTFLYSSAKRIVAWRRVSFGRFTSAVNETGDILFII